MRKTIAEIDTQKGERLVALSKFKEGDRVFNKLTKQHGVYAGRNGQSFCWVRFDILLDEEWFIPRLIDGESTDPLNLELCQCNRPIPPIHNPLPSSVCSQESVGFVQEGLNEPALMANLELPNLSSLPSIPEKSLADTTPTSPSTTILEPLTQNQEALTLSAADSPVRTFPAPENKPELEEKDQDCSSRLSDSFAWYDQNSSSWKTSQTCLLTEWEPYLGNFPKSGTMRNGRLYPAPRWVEFTSESECSSSLIPTPTASDATMGAILNENTKIVYTGNGTPRKISNAGVSGSLGLSRFAAMLPTPKAIDGIHPGVQSHKKGQTLHLSAAVMLPTPTARDWKHGSAAQVERDRSENLNDRMAAVTGNPKLNVNFVEAMMSFPPDWTLINTMTTCLDQKTSPNGSTMQLIQKTSPIEKNGSNASETVLLVIAPPSLGEESPALQEVLKESDQWGTPDTEGQPILTLIKQVLGGEIGLDPTSNHERRTGAIAHFTQADNCLDKDWSSTGVFMNPPFSKPLPFVAKLCEEFAAGHFKSAIALLKAGCVNNKGTGALIEKHASAILQWRSPRIRFVINGQQTNGSPDFDCAIIYFGDNPQLFDKLFSPYGTISILKDAPPLPEDAPVIVASVVGEELTIDEEKDRQHLERKVESAFIKAESVFREAVFALKEIRDRKLYRSSHATFEEYCKDRFNFKRARPYQLINAANVLENLGECLQIVDILPTKESHCRELTMLSDPEEQREAWVSAVQSNKNGKVPAAIEIKSVVERIKERTGALPPPDYKVGEVVEIRSGGTKELRKHDGMWGIVSHVGSIRCTVHISLRNVTLQCKPTEMDKVHPMYTADIKAVSERIKELSKLDLNPAVWAILETLAHQTCFDELQMELLEWVEKRYGI